jgi:RNase P/RNase MRP subunit POP5
MLNRRSKRRYVCILHVCEANDSVNAIKKRYSELFGSIGTEKAAIKLVRSNANRAIIKCRLEELDNVLVAITFTCPSPLVLDVSGSIKRLQFRKGEVKEANEAILL